MTAAALLIAGALATFARVPLWLAALVVAGPILAAEHAAGTGVLLAVPLTIAGAGAGVFVRRRIAGS